jgi:rRNA maturation RNase YbeY
VAINFFSEATAFRYNGKRRTRTWIQRVVTAFYDRECGDISVIFCSDDYLLQLNRQYLQHDYYTDVITFDYSQPPVVSGDVFISIDTVRSNVKCYQSTLYDELHRVIIHGVLHLCGEKDKTARQQQQMRAAEERALGSYEIW